MFSLRGIDLARALKSHDIHIEREAAATLPTVADLLHGSALTAPDDEAVQPHDTTPLPVPFDLSTLPALLDPLTQVLQARPACFAGGDLKTIYRQTIAKAARQARRVISTTGRTAHGAPAAIFHHEDRPHIEISDQYIAELHGLGGINDWPELAAALDTLQPGELLSMQPELAALYDTRIVALHLLAAGAVTAEMFSLGGQSVGLRWLPALLDSQVRACMQHLSAALPADIVTHRPDRGHSVSVPANAQAIVLCSLFLDAFIRQWSGAQDARPAGDKTLDLFFISGRTRYDGPGEGAMAVGIQGWFARHHIAHHAHTPVICLNETPGGDLAITIAIGEPAAAQTKAIKSIPARSFIATSGTPVENRLSEYWSIMDFANRGYLGSLSAFIKEYATPIQTQHDARVIERFQRVMAPFLLRRLKSDKQIIDDLPDKIEQNQYCTLTPTQTALYESVVREGLRVIQGVSDSFRRQGLVLQLMLALKQICNHPALYLKQSDTKAQLSGKAARFLELIDNIRASREKVLVFTQLRAMGELLSEWIRERYGQAPLFLHGGVSRTQRDALVERFQNDRTEQVFLLSLKAGGTGLNLTAATHVIHYDLWWNPAVEAQATDRAYRIGQHANVQVHRLITRGTLEEHIDELIQAKRVLANLAVGTGEKWIGTLDETELEQLFTLNG